MKSTLYLTLMFLLSSMLSCDRDKNNPGYDYFPDMAYSKAYETYSPNPNFDDRQTLRTPVAGTISRESENYPFPRSEAGMQSAVMLQNPFTQNKTTIERGKVIYERVCLQCHGENADGKGHLFTSGKYPFPPANLLNPIIVNRTDGQMYHVITVGYRIMEPHGLIVKPEDRWKVILYIRSLQSNRIEN